MQSWLSLSFLHGRFVIQRTCNYLVKARACTQGCCLWLEFTLNLLILLGYFLRTEYLVRTGLGAMALSCLFLMHLML